MFSQFQISGKRKTPSPEITLQESNKKQTVQPPSSLIAQTALAPFSTIFPSAKRKNSDDSSLLALKNQRIEQKNALSEEDEHESALSHSSPSLQLEKPHVFRPAFFEPASQHSSINRVHFSSLSNAPSARPPIPFSGDAFQLMRDEQAEPDSDDESDPVFPPVPETPPFNPANVPVPTSPAVSSQLNRMPEPEPEIMGFGSLSLGEPAQSSVTSALSNFSFSSISTDASTAAFFNLLKQQNAKF